MILPTLFWGHSRMSFGWGRRINDAAKSRITAGKHDDLIAFEGLLPEATLSAVSGDNVRKTGKGRYRQQRYFSAKLHEKSAFMITAKPKFVAATG